MQKYVANLAFEDYEPGEILEAEPSMVADWLESRFISEVDERGDRIVVHDSDPGAPEVEEPPVTDTTTGARPPRSGGTPDEA